jgi:cytochrome c2
MNSPYTIANQIFPEEDMMNILHFALALFLTLLISCGGPAGGGRTSSGTPANNQGGNTSGAVDQTTGAGLDATANEIKMGNEVFTTFGCMNCHKVGDEGGAIGPNLTTIGQSMTFDELKAFIKDPKSIKPNTTMPTPSLTDEQVQAVARYLSMLK